MKKMYILSAIMALVFIAGCESRTDAMQKEALALLAKPAPAEYSLNEQTVINESSATLEAAEGIFDVKLDVAIRFGELKGVATSYKLVQADKSTRYLLGFNAEHVDKNLHLVTTQAVPHEVAHFVAWEKGDPNAHSPSWRSYCRQLTSKSNCNELITKSG